MSLTTEKKALCQPTTVDKEPIKSILQLVDFYEKNIEQLDSVQKNFIVADMLYPQIKILDMGFWQIGFDLDNKIIEYSII